MKPQKKNKMTQVISSILLIGACSTSMADNNQPKNFFISYVSAPLAKSIAQFAVDQQLGGLFMWEMRLDTDPGKDPNSLLAAMASVNHHPKINAFWSNAGSHAGDRIPFKGDENSAFVNKANLVDSITYAFMEIHSTGNKMGSIHFSDPLSDLSKTSFRDFCYIYMPICSTDQAPSPWVDADGLGNFEAFSEYHSASGNKIQKIVSIGGPNHNDSFEVLFGNPQNIQNFIDSLLVVTYQYHINAWDMDYENPQMTQSQSIEYLAVLTALDKSLPADVSINVDIISDPAYIISPQPTIDLRNPPGFAPGILKAISQLKHFGQFNLISYDFHGAIDYNPKHPYSAKTGFLTNIVMPTDAPALYDPKFSINTSIQALMTTGIPAHQISIGIPAYGRAVANVIPNSKDTEKTGLFARVNAGPYNIPIGNLDDPKCEQALPMNIPAVGSKSKACTGTFSYSYMMTTMLSNGSGFTAKDWMAKDGKGKEIINGATAFQDASPTPSGGK